MNHVEDCPTIRRVNGHVDLSVQVMQRLEVERGAPSQNSPRSSSQNSPRWPALEQAYRERIDGPSPRAAF
eukprot:3115047-Prymnesium_polylepis.1